MLELLKIGRNQSPYMSEAATKDRTYSISELSREFDITTRTIRFYEDKGLIKPKRNGQTRIYSASDRVTLKLILRGKRLGLSLEESRDIIAMYRPGGANNAKQLQTLINAIQERKKLLQQQMQDIESMMLDLQESENRCIEALAQIDH